VLHWKGGKQLEGEEMIKPLKSQMFFCCCLYYCCLIHYIFVMNNNLTFIWILTRLCQEIYFARCVKNWYFGSLYIFLKGVKKNHINIITFTVKMLYLCFVLSMPYLYTTVNTLLKTSFLKQKKVLRQTLYNTESNINHLKYSL
jgi:hypothetical protein